jgi:hypothetical protein
MMGHCTSNEPFRAAVWGVYKAARWDGELSNTFITVKTMVQFLALATALLAAATAPRLSGAQTTVTVSGTSSHAVPSTLCACYTVLPSMRL